jgi:hypothetical protein
MNGHKCTAKRSRTGKSEDFQVRHESSGREQLLVTSPELQTRLGKKYVDETDFFPLLLAHGIVRRVRTIEVGVRPLGGDSFQVTLDAAKPSVGELKAEIDRVHGTFVDYQEIYKVAFRADGAAVREDDAEPEHLNDNSMEVGAGELFTMTVKPEPPLAWGTFATDRVAFSDGLTVATQIGEVGSLVTSGVELTRGQHYWEVELMSDEVSGILVGVTRPDLDPKIFHGYEVSNDAWLIGAGTGSLCGNGKFQNDPAGDYKQGDRVGLLLDLDDGSLCFFKNGVKHGPGYLAGSVTGPVVHAMQLTTQHRQARLLGKPLD